MNIYSDTFYDFVETHLNDDVSRLLLSASRYDENIDVRAAALQIQCRQKTAHKLTPLLAHPRFIFPDLISAEQASDWRVANYHACVIGGDKTIMDMTAGLGVDSIFLAGKGHQIISIDVDSNKADILRYNANLLRLKNIDVLTGDSVKFFRDKSYHIDSIFIDPARRNQNNQRTYALSDCQPDIVSIHREMLEMGMEVWIKASPMLDVSAIRHKLSGISDISCVSVEGECKEVLIHLVPDKLEKKLEYKAVDLDRSGGVKSDYTFCWNSKLAPKVWPSQQLPDSGYIYRPNASLMKLPAAGSLTSSFDSLWKIGLNTELYFSEIPYSDFPGDCYKMISKIDKKSSKQLEGVRGIVISRNYPDDTSKLRKRLKIKEGDDNVFIGCKVGLKAKPALFRCSKNI